MSLLYQVFPAFASPIENPGEPIWVHRGAFCSTMYRELFPFHLLADNLLEVVNAVAADLVAGVFDHAIRAPAEGASGHVFAQYNPVALHGNLQGVLFVIHFQHTTVLFRDDDTPDLVYPTNDACGPHGLQFLSLYKWFQNILCFLARQHYSTKDDKNKGVWIQILPLLFCHFLCNIHIKYSGKARNGLNPAVNISKSS